MQKQMYFIGACALVAAAAIFVWSQNALVSSHANTASASPLPVAEAATMSPTEMMTNHNKPLPVERWDAF